MEIVDIGCPRSIDLLSINSKKDKDTRNILQTVDIYDHVVIKQDIKNKSNALIKTSDNVRKGTNEKLTELLLIYSNYINMKLNNISVNVNYNDISCLKKEENILAGFLLALNYYFKNNLTTHELVYLASKIDNLIGYYIVGGYKKIDSNNKNISIGKNIYNKYYLLENFNNNEKIKEIFEKYKVLYGIDDCYYVPNDDNNIVPSKLLINLKREYPDTKIRTVNNSSDHKVLVKYIR